MISTYNRVHAGGRKTDMTGVWETEIATVQSFQLAFIRAKEVEFGILKGAS